jgi:sulfatase-like protein
MPGLSLFTLFRQQPARERAEADEDLSTDGNPQPEGHAGAGAATHDRDDRDDRDDRRWRSVAALATNMAATVLAGLLVWFVLIAPNRLDLLTPGALVRIPIEGLLLVALVLVLPVRAGRVVAVVAGVALGLLMLVKILDMGFSAVLDRSFDLVLDWSFFGNAMDYLTMSMGRLAAIAIAIGVVALATALIVVITLSVLRLTRVASRYRARAAGSLAVCGVVWLTCAALGAQLVDGQPVAAWTTAFFAYHRALSVNASLHDHAPFSRELAVDPFRYTPNAQLLTALRGKDVVFAFVESYGRSAVEDPRIAPGVDAVLDAGTRSLRAAGFASESAWLTSPTSGGGSWLAHSTLLSGVWVDNQHRYNTLVTSKRLTLTNAFRHADWRTVAVLPDTTGPWSDGSFYGYDKIYAAHNLGYHGPTFGWATMPDEYVLSALQRLELTTGHAPVMAEMALVSSHAPWAPLPRMIPWNDVGDGSVFDPMPATGKLVSEVWPDPGRVRTEYGRSIQYTLSSLISYLETYGTDRTVLVFLGDHQPAPIVTGGNASRDVPITIVARDPAVLSRISGWGWEAGLKPGPRAPVWPMSAFRDRFLTAFSPEAR